MGTVRNQPKVAVSSPRGWVAAGGGLLGASCREGETPKPHLGAPRSPRKTPLCPSHLSLVPPVPPVPP